MVLMVRFCILFFGFKTGNYHMQARFVQAGIDRDSFMDLRHMDLA